MQGFYSQLWYHLTSSPLLTLYFCDTMECASFSIFWVLQQSCKLSIVSFSCVFFISHASRLRLRTGTQAPAFPLLLHGSVGSAASWPSVPPSPRCISSQVVCTLSSFWRVNLKAQMHKICFQIESREVDGNMDFILHFNLGRSLGWQIQKMHEEEIVS